MPNFRRFIDIGANLTDPMFQGIYNNAKKHESDLLDVLKRSFNDCGLKKIIITAGSYEESKKALELAETDERLYSTVGCHPTRCKEFEDESTTPEKYVENLERLIRENPEKIVAFGECGLDYDRLGFCPKETQKKYLEMQLKLNESLKLPLFLHCRNAASDLYEILITNKFGALNKGVVHSFDGTLQEAEKFIDLGLKIGLNGCSLKTAENLETVKKLPIEHILLETDAPWCEIKQTHAGYKYIKTENRNNSIKKKEKWQKNCMIKGRNEPTNIKQVFDILAEIKKDEFSADKICETIFQNTQELFKFPSI